MNVNVGNPRQGLASGYFYSLYHTREYRAGGMAVLQEYFRKQVLPLKLILSMELKVPSSAAIFWRLGHVVLTERLQENISGASAFNRSPIPILPFFYR